MLHILRKSKNELIFKKKLYPNPKNNFEKKIFVTPIVYHVSSKIKNTIVSKKSIFPCNGIVDFALQSQIFFPLIVLKRALGSFTSVNFSCTPLCSVITETRFRQ